MKKLMYFGASWCAPCKIMKPIVKELQEEGFEIKYVDVDKDFYYTEQMNVSSVPAFIIAEDDVVLNQISGSTSKDTLRTFFASA